MRKSRVSKRTQPKEQIIYTYLYDKTKFDFELEDFSILKFVYDKKVHVRKDNDIYYNIPFGEVFMYSLKIPKLVFDFYSCEYFKLGKNSSSYDYSKSFIDNFCIEISNIIKKNTINSYVRHMHYMVDKFDNDYFKMEIIIDFQDSSLSDIKLTYELNKFIFNEFEVYNRHNEIIFSCIRQKELHENNLISHLNQDIIIINNNSKKSKYFNFNNNFIIDMINEISKKYN